jgi:hypothetical protein
MVLFDRIIADHRRTTIADLGNGPFDQFFKVMVEIGFEREARQNLIQPVVLFITDSAPFTAQTYAKLRGRLEQTLFVPVHNEAASFMLIAQDFPPSSPKYQTIRIPRLSPIVRRISRTRITASDRATGNHRCAAAAKLSSAKSARPRARSRRTNFALMTFEADQCAHRHAEFSDFVGAAEIRQIDDKAGGEHIGAELL